MPILGVAGAIGAGVVIVLVVIQSGGSGGTDAAIAAEADASASVPGEFVDLPAIYGGAYPATAGHVSEQVDYSAQDVNPPVGGPHWSGRGCEDPANAAPFCGPAPWGIFRDAYEAETLVHNMEHGGVVVWYNFDDVALRDELEAVVAGLLDDGHQVVMAPFPEMEEDMIAVTSWSRIDKFPVSDFDAGRVETFITTNDRRFNPEDF